ncbi:MAG: PPOX class F420-dependent oxidoreductase [Dehalococcoidia bacterium]
MEMSHEAIADFLQQKRVGVLGINRKNAPPQLVPVWYLYDDEAIWIMSEKEVPKVGNIRRDPRVTLCVDDKILPYKGVVIYGTVTLTEDNIHERRRAIAQRYLGESEGEAYAAQPRPRGKILLKLVPERTYSWDRGLADRR